MPPKDKNVEQRKQTQQKLELIVILQRDVVGDLQVMSRICSATQRPLAIVASVGPR